MNVYLWLIYFDKCQVKKLNLGFIQRNQNTMKDFIALDFETATQNRNSMCAIGLVVVKDNVIIEKFYALVQPPNNEYNHHTIEVHRILPEFTANAPAFPELYTKLKSYLHNSTVVCHNADFDINVLKQTMNFYDIQDDLKMDIYCTMRIYGGSGLSVCCQEHGIPLHHHDPLSDAEACAYLFMKHSDDFTEFTFNKRIPEKTKSYQVNGIQRIKGNILKPDYEHAVDKTNFFFGKKVVISGTYENWPDRNDLAKIVKALGADIDTGVTSRTNVLIAGEGAGPSKIEKMMSNIELGKNAVILTENDVCEIVIDFLSNNNQTE